MKPTYEELEAKCAALAAENAALKKLSMEVYEDMDSLHDTDALYSLDADGEKMDALIRLCDAQSDIYQKLVIFQSPATDAFLAEVRAQGVEMFAIEWGGYDSPYGQDAYNFADKIRKGVQA